MAMPKTGGRAFWASSTKSAAAKSLPHVLALLLCRAGLCPPPVEAREWPAPGGRFSELPRIPRQLMTLAR